MLELVWISLACAAIAMGAGMLWFGPLFSQPWTTAMGWSGLSDDERKERAKAAGPGYLVTAIGAIIGALVLWVIFDASYTDFARLGKAGWGLALGLLVWIGFYLPATAMTTFFETRNWRLWQIDAGYRFVVFGLWGLTVGLLHV